MQVNIVLKQDLIDIALEDAEEFGMSITEYIKLLIISKRAKKVTKDIYLKEVNALIERIDQSDD